ncbi:MAG TPA: hypothetical protein VHW01_24700, partial [Polyangiaceae bacterium]|nr:hypothetical protein [Polyangiaceae bacterium]
MSLRVSVCHVVLAGSVSFGCSASDPTAPSNSAGGGAGATSAGAGSGGTSIPTAGNSGSGAGATSFAGSGGSAAGAGGSTAAGGGAGGMSVAGGTSGGGTGGAVTNGGAAGAAGATMHPGQAIYPPTASERKAPEFTLPAPANPKGLILRYMNNCPQTLWVHADGIPGGVVVLPGRAPGQPPTEEVYDWP